MYTNTTDNINPMSKCRAIVPESTCNVTENIQSSDMIINTDSNNLEPTILEPLVVTEMSIKKENMVSFIRY